MLATAWLTAPAHAATCTFQPSNVDQSWHNPANWFGCGGVAPQAADDVMLGNYFAPNDRDITVSAPITVRSLQAGVGQTRRVILTGQTFTLGGTGLPTARLDLDPFVISGGGKLVIDGSPQVFSTPVLGGAGDDTQGTIEVAAGATPAFFTAPIIEAEPGLGTFRALATSTITTGQQVEIKAKLDLRGTLSSPDSNLLLEPSAGSAQMTGTISAGAGRQLLLRLTKGATWDVAGTLQAAGILFLTTIGAGFDRGVLDTTGTAIVTAPRVVVQDRAFVVLDADASWGELDMIATSGPAGAGRGGIAALTITGPGSDLGAGRFSGPGSTTFEQGFTRNAPNTFTEADGATVRVQGTSTVGAGTLTTLGVGRWVNEGTMTMSGGSGLQRTSGTGSVVNAAGATLRRTGSGQSFANATIENSGDLLLEGGTLGSPGSPDPVVGPVRNKTGGLVAIPAGTTLAMDVVLESGVLRGGGTVRSVDNQAGTVRPGDSPGTLTVQQAFTQGPSGTLEAEIESASAYDRIVASGPVSVAGTITPLVDPGYTPAPETVYDIVTGTSRTGEWTTIGPGGFVGYYPPTIAGLCFGTCPVAAPPATFPLTVTRAGSGTGTVTSAPGGIACGGDCSQSYDDGTSVTLSAAPAAGSTFGGWSGACSGTGACVVAMTQARSVTATFDQVAAPPPPPDTPPPPPPPSSEPAPEPPAPAVPAAPASAVAPSIEQLVTFPSAKRCASRRSFRIRLRIPKGFAVREAVVRVNGKRVRVVKGSRLTAPVDLRSFVKGRFTVSIAVTARDGRVVRGSRKYRTCAKKQRGGKVRL